MTKLCCVINEYFTCTLCSTTQCKECWMESSKQKLKHYGINGTILCPITDRYGILTASTPYKIIPSFKYEQTLL